MRGSLVSALMSEAAGNWVTCPDCGNKFYAVDTDGDVECDECGTTV
jgi:ribosomal protein S27E